jgi:hypothetical protein
VTIDGTIDTDWSDGNRTVTVDAPNEDIWGAGDDWGLNSLRIAVNSTGIAFGLNASLASDANGFLLFIDIDKGGNGLTDHSLSSEWSRNAKFLNGFVPDYFFGTWGSADWALFNYTDNVGGAAWLDPAILDYGSKTGNQTASAGPSIFHYEGYIGWSLLYPSAATTVPANAEIRVVAAMFGGGGGDPPADLLPDSMNMGDPPEEVSNYLIVNVDSDGDGAPELPPEPTAVGWAGNEEDNSFSGIMPKGFIVDFKVSVWYEGSVHSHPNASYDPMLILRTYDDSAGTWSSNATYPMVHVAGDYQGNNDWHYRQIDTTPLDSDDIIEWLVKTSYGETAQHNITIGPLPPVDIGFVGNVQPSGGFILPNQLVNITVDVEQLLNGTDHVQKDVDTNVTLYYEIDNTGGWLMKDFTFKGSAGTQNSQFNNTIGPYADGTNITYYVNVTNNNTVVTGNFTIHILVPPPESTIFTMTDPMGDENGVYPTNEVFDPGFGYHDILNFTVTGNEWLTSFRFKIYNVTDPGWGGGHFSFPIFAVMVDTGATGGSTESFGNTYVTVEEDHAWEYGFQVDNWIQRYYTPATLAEPQESGHGITTYTDLDFVNDEYWIGFQVPTYLTDGAATSSWSYVAMIGNGDYNQFRLYNAEVSEWNFGGGADGEYDPNYIDLLVPAGGNSTWVQEYITNGYDISSQTLATVLAVGPGISYVDDATKPTVTISSPADGSSYNITSGTTYDVTVKWTTSDPDDSTFSGLAKLELFVDGVLEPSVSLGDTEATLSLEAGSHTIRINSYDNTGNFGSAEITVTITGQETTTTTTPPPAIPGLELLSILGLVALAIIVRRKK